MAEYEHKPTIIICVTRCWDCKRYYGHEKNVDARCPHCAKESVTRLIAERDAQERSIRSLRGALTRKQVKRGK